MPRVSCPKDKRGFVIAGAALDIAVSHQHPLRTQHSMYSRSRLFRSKHAQGLQSPCPVPHELMLYVWESAR